MRYIVRSYGTASPMVLCISIHCRLHIFNLTTTVPYDPDIHLESQYPFIIEYDYFLNVCDSVHNIHNISQRNPLQQIPMRSNNVCHQKSALD